MSDDYNNSDKPTKRRGVSHVPLARLQQEVEANDEPSALGIRGAGSHSLAINTTTLFNKSKGKDSKTAINHYRNDAASSPSSTTLPFAASASLPIIATSSNQPARRRGSPGMQPMLPTVSSIVQPTVRSDNADDNPSKIRPGAVRVSGIQSRYDDNASVVSEFDTTVVSTKSEHTESNPFEVEIVTDDEIRNRIQEELLQDVVEANVLQREKDGEVVQSTARNQRKLVIVVVAILLVAVLVVVIPLVVPWKARRGNRSGDVSPTESRLVAFRSIFLNQSMSSTDALFNASSPQYLALDWLATKDPARLLPQSTAYDVIKERFVIATLYFATNGDNWNNSFQFLSGESICQWNSRPNNETFGVTCGPNNVTQDLNLQGNGLAGTIPPELGELSSLTNLNIAVNRLIGTVPTDLQKLTSLVGLRFNKNQLSGKVPTELYSLSSLIRFWHGFNAFSGTIPTEIGRLSSLDSWRLGTNHYTGRIPTELGRLSNLTNLDLSNNALTGTVPTSLRALSKLDSLYLANTNLTGNLTSIFCLSDPDTFESDYCTQEVACSCCTNFCN